MLNLLPLELRQLVLDKLQVASLGALLATSKVWCKYVTQYLSWLLRDSPELQKILLLPGGARRCHWPALANLRISRAIICVGGYNSAWNGHAHGDMADDGPGCERSAEPVAVVGRHPWIAPSPAWLQLPDLRERRADLALVATSASTVYALGGREGSVAKSSCERLHMPLWQLRGEGWQGAAPMACARYGHVAVCLGGTRLCVAGGAISAPNEGVGLGTRTAEMLSLDGAGLEAEWTPLPSMMYRHSYGCSVVHDGAWYVLGGDGLVPRNARKVEMFDPVAGWVKRTSMQCCRFSAAAVSYGGRIVVVGGTAQLTDMSAEAYDPREGRWQAISRLCRTARGLLAPLVGHCAVCLNDDQLFLLGGMYPGHHMAAGQPPWPHPQWRYWHEDDVLGGSSKYARALDLNELNEGATASEAPQPLRANHMRTPRWCGSACVISMAC